MRVEGLDECVDRSEVLGMLVADGQEALAEQFATSLGRGYQVEFVQACLELGRLKPAAKAVRALGLQKEFPDVEALYREHSLRRLMERRLWQVALSYVGQDARLQALLLGEMVAAGEASLADDYRRQMGLPAAALPIDAAALAAAAAVRAERYLQPALPPGAARVVDAAGQLAEAGRKLLAADAVGVDVEWQPSHCAGGESPAALLQVATREEVFLFDLLALAASHPAELSACLAPLLESETILKLGFELSGDLSKLAGSWPAVAAFARANAVLDLRPLWVAYGLKQRAKGLFPTATARTLREAGLSALCAALLGRPLDKSMQLSDCEQPPPGARRGRHLAVPLPARRAHTRGSPARVTSRPRHPAAATARAPRAVPPGRRGGAPADAAPGGVRRARRALPCPAAGQAGGGPGARRGAADSRQHGRLPGRRAAAREQARARRVTGAAAAAAAQGPPRWPLWMKQPRARALPPTAAAALAAGAARGR
ncbi:MAG: ribonuclease H-like domain-containing protein [Monoraphidium minutum]|nr:MAG: ribonuclease H-like domain-containing protein [Monoraphidium minutum]